MTRKARAHMKHRVELLCKVCKFRTKEKDIELYIHTIEMHRVPHHLAQVIYTEAIQKHYPRERWTERLEHTRERKDQEATISPAPQLQLFKPSKDKEKGP